MRSRAPAIALIALVCAGVVALILLSRAMGERYGPSAGTQLADGRTVIASHGYLHIFDGARRAERIALRELGLAEVPGDLDVLGDGDLLVADTRTRTLVRCNLPERRCRTFFDGAAAASGAIRQAFKAEVEQGLGRVVVSDSSNHRLLLLDPAGKLITATATNGPRFNFPNGLAFGADGLLAVADTDHQRLTLMRLDAEMMRPEPGDIALAKALGGINAFSPIDVRPDAGGRWWVIVADNTLRRGTLVVLDGEGRLLRHVTLGPDPDPLALVALPDAMLVLQPGVPAVARVALDGATQPFGDEAFAQELAAERERLARLSNARLAVQALLVIVFLLALVVATRGRGTVRQLRLGWSIPQAPLPLPAPVTWIEANPRPLRALALALLLATALLLALLWLYLPSALKLDAAREQALWKISLYLLALPFFALLILHRPRKRLGTDGRSLLLADGGGNWSAPLDAVRYSRTRLLVGHRMVRLRMPGADLFPLDRVAGLLLSRLPPEAHLPEWRLTLLALRQQLGQWRALLSRSN